MFVRANLESETERKGSIYLICVCFENWVVLVKKLDIYPISLVALVHGWLPSSHALHLLKKKRVIQSRVGLFTCLNSVFEKNLYYYFKYFYFRLFWSIDTTRKPINTNGNTERIFSLVNFREIFPTDIFLRYIPRELWRDKKIKIKQKKWWRVRIYQRNYRRNTFCR